MQFKEQISIQNSFSVQPAETLDKTILHGSARLRVLNTNVVLFCPCGKLMRGKLRSVIHSDSYRFAPFMNHSVQYSCPLLADKEVSISIASTSLVQSSMMFSVLNVLPFTILSLMKSMLHIWLMAVCLTNGCFILAGNLRLPLLLLFSFSSLYTRYTFLWFQLLPSLLR